jgi:GH15 family glucan-1,4-alpha-glucosidase
LNCFTETYNSDQIDASGLLLARSGFISASDPRYISTVRLIQKRLARNGLIDRFENQKEDPRRGTFVVCSLWMVLSLLEIDSLGEAEILFSRVLGSANDLGIYSEGLALDSSQVGNFPQAFIHIALIICAFALDRRKDTLTHVLSRRLADQLRPGIE